MNQLNFKDIVAKVKGLPTKTKNIILLVIGLAIFLLAYTMGFQKIQEKTSAVQTEVDKQSAYVHELKDYYNNLQTYEKGIQESRDSVNTNLSHLPRGIETEDFVEYIKTAMEKMNGDLKSVSVGTPSLVVQFPSVADDKSVQMDGQQVSASFNADMRYPDFKNFLDYVYEDTSEMTYIGDVSVVFNPESAMLSTLCEISKLYVTYDGSVYVPADIPDVPKGTSNPFGTGSNS